MAGRELLARWWAYATVRWCEHLPPVPAAELARRVERLGDHSRWGALWRLEALGYRHARGELRRGADLAGLLAPSRVGPLPATALPLLYAGAGLALFHRRLAALAADEPAMPAVARTVALCRRFAHPGLAPAALEPLGLAVRYFQPPRVAEVAAGLEPFGEALGGYFWHGVGRCLYFLPGHLGRLDGPGAALARLAEEVPPGPPRKHALAGLVFAVVLVNMRRPQVLEAMLRRHGRTEGRPAEGNEATADDAFEYGVASALAARVAVSAGHPDIVRRFLDHRPASDVAPAWRHRVTEPGRRGVHELLPALHAAGRVGELCRYLPPADGWQHDGAETAPEPGEMVA